MNLLIINGSSDLYGANRILLQVIEALNPRKVFLIVPQEGLLTEFIKTNSEYSHVQVIGMSSTPVIYRKMGVTEGVRLLIKIIAFRNKVKRIIKEQKSGGPM